MRVGMLNSINFFSGLNAAVTVVFSDRDCYIKGLKLFRFDNVIRSFGYIFTSHAQIRQFRSCRYKSRLAIRFGDLDFL